MNKQAMQKTKWDHSNDEKFVEYYASESESKSTTQRFQAVFRTLLLQSRKNNDASKPLQVADIGCGTGNQAFLWAEDGHDVHAIDVAEPLVTLGRARAAQRGLEVDFQLGSASELPWPNVSMDVCIALELLEHIEDWQSCLDEFARILKPGGLLCLSTTNRLCPIQQEFSSPFYSWYPSRVKRRYEQLARTSRPDLVNYATYPAVNWFSFYSLRKALAELGFDTLDKFDCMGNDDSTLRNSISTMIRWISPLRLLAHLVTTGTFIVAVKY